MNITCKFFIQNYFCKDSTFVSIHKVYFNFMGRYFSLNSINIDFSSEKNKTNPSLSLLKKDQKRKCPGNLWRPAKMMLFNFVERNELQISGCLNQYLYDVYSRVKFEFFFFFYSLTLFIPLSVFLSSLILCLLNKSHSWSHVRLLLHMTN